MFIKIYIYLGILIIGLINSQAYSQLDSINEKGSDQEVLANIIQMLSNYKLPADQQKNLSNRAKELAQKLNDKKSLCLSYKFIGLSYYSALDYENAIKNYQIGLALANKIKDSSIISDCYYNISFSYMAMGNYGEALKNSKIAFDLDNARNDSVAMAESYNSIGIIYERIADYHTALSFYYKSLDILEKNADSLGIAQRYNNIGIIFYNLSDFIKAHSYYTKSINLFQSLGNLQEKCKPMISMGDLYERMEKFDSSLLLFRQVLEISNQFDDKNLKANILSRLGDIFYIKGDYPKALSNYLQSNELKQIIKDYDGLVGSEINLAKIYAQTDNISKAQYHLKKAKELERIVNSKRLRSDIYKLYYTIYKLQKDIPNALKYYELYTDVKDSIFSEINNKKIYELQTIYETEKKEKENENYRKTNEINELELARSKTFRNFLLIIALFILILTAILYGRYQSKLKINSILNEKNKILESQKVQISLQKSEIETKNMQITDSIEYAHFIQQSMISDAQILTNAFPESFILFLPRDIVSGDFYWLFESKNKTVIVVADCTGHGVPGALMSILGIQILTEIFEYIKIKEADIALNFLRQSIYTALHQQKTGNQDGMDVAICIVDKQNKTIDFAGARRPMIYIENDKLNEIKGSRLSIGGQPATGGSFEKNTIQYNSPISVYMFSDGYYDQFGGTHNGKISYNLFKELLYLNSGKSMQKQKESLEDFLISWKGDVSQIDDILVLGFRTE